MTTYDQRLDRARSLLESAELLLIGGGAGLSAAAGLTYSGDRFTQHFGPYIARYGMTDMYTSSFYPFETEEERWAYWALHIGLNRYDPPSLPLYRALAALASRLDHFVLTTNVDHQFVAAGFDPDLVFAVQGDYGFLQCATACHRTLYDNAELVAAMRAATVDCRVPSELVPWCPICGGPMDVNLRKDRSFVQDAAWDAAAARYEAFVERAARQRTVLLELGVGFNTPGIIRHPFEVMTFRFPETSLIRVNRDYPDGAAENAGRTVTFTEDLATVVRALQGKEDR